MRRKLLRILACVMVFCMILSVGAMGIETNTEIIIIDDIDEQKAQLIINNIIGGNGETETGISPASILCIFGHDMACLTVWEIIHRYYTTSPRCLQNKYNVVYCARSSCNYSVMTLIGQVRIHCCA